MSDAPWVEQLLRSEALPHALRNPQLIETHISWLLLTGDWVYKIKKPVDLGFLDFSTLAQRRFYCEEELRLNRRFAPDLYVGLCAVTAGAEGPHIDGDGEVIDWAVKMRQFDQRERLDAIAERGELDATLLRQLARQVAALHTALPPCWQDEPGAHTEQVAATLRENFTQIDTYPLDSATRALLSGVRHCSETRLAAAKALMMERCEQGWVRECHGDLHLANIARWRGEIRLFDCIEFNAALREIDSAAEIAFLCMDLDARGHGGLAWRLLNDYLEYRDDYVGLALFDLFRSHYALVRAKVDLLRLPPSDPQAPCSEEFLLYLALAHSYGTPRPRFLALMYGVSGSGKSTVAMDLAMRCGAVRLRSDVERKRLFGLAPEQRSEAGRRDELYAAATTAQVFERLLHLAGTVLDAGFACIVDATFLHQRARAPFQQLAATLGVPFFILQCHCAEAELVRRLLSRRGDASEADVAVMEQQRRHSDPFGEAEQARLRCIDSTAPLPLELLRELGATG